MEEMYSWVLATLLMTCWASSSEYKVTDRIYFDVRKDNQMLGRIILGLFGEVAPDTCENFKTIALKGISGRSYVGTKFHTAISRVMIQGGDIVNNDGTGSVSIYGDYFKDENFTIKHDSPGLLVMANKGPNTNGCQFFITTMATPWLDGKNVVFGKVLKGEEIVHKIEHMKTDVNDKLLSNVYISEVGIIETVPFSEPSKNYELTFWAWIRAGWFPLSFSFAIMGFFQYLMVQLNKLSSFQ
nr:peptidyl-prolyl cis-trans isomerase-like isoform X1 [Leptinotarsa decemlineata]